jgi:hypothetical protein
MKELGEALKAIFDKFSNFFDILDLSFFVAGAASFSALLFYWTETSSPRLLSSPPAVAGSPPAVAGIAATLIGCYVLGLICFAAGRYVRSSLARILPSQPTFDTLFDEVMMAHGLCDREPVNEYLRRSGVKDFRGRLYSRLWTEVRQSESLKASFALLNRYWVMSATYDGLATALGIWAFVFIALAIRGRLSPILAVVTAVIFPILVAACLREAGRYGKSQLEELAATVAYKIASATSLEPAAAPTVATASPAPMPIETAPR